MSDDVSVRAGFALVVSRSAVPGRAAPRSVYLFLSPGVAAVSLHSYWVSRGLVAWDPPFNALVMAAIHKADPDNMVKLVTAFPDIWTELMNRYNAPGGAIDGEVYDPAFGRACMAEVGQRG